jgi:DNA helicase IV
MSVAPELAHERDYLARARTELTRMGEQTLSLEAHGGDRVSSEFLAATLYRRAQSLIDDPTTSLFFGRIDQDPGGAHHPQRWYIGRRHVATPKATPLSSTGGLTSRRRSTGHPGPSLWE